MSRAMVVNGQQWNREVTKYHKVNTTQHVTKNLCRNYTSTR